MYLFSFVMVLSLKEYLHILCLIFRNILNNTSYPEAGYEFGQFLKSTDGIFGKFHFLRLTAFRNWISIPDIINEEKKVMVW